MKRHSNTGIPGPLAVAMTTVLCLLAVTPAASGAESVPQMQWYGDFRARLESDWDSRTSTGSERDDRDRLRSRVRLGVTWRPSEIISVGARLRTGSKDSHQSPHITVADFNGNPVGDSDLVADKWFVKYTRNQAWAWLGRESSPFWQQNELLWDEDVTPVGAAGGYRSGSWTVNAGYFALPVGMRDFAGNLGAAQLLYSGRLGRHGVTVAAGYFDFDADKGDPDAATLRNGNGLRDYRIASVSAQWKLDLATGRPLTLGVDLHHNTQSYPAAGNWRNQRDGHVLSAVYGQLGKPGDWLLGVYQARIERFAVNASYAQDDWVRWGSATETDASDFKGIELRFARALSKNSNVMLRYYDAEALTSVQDGKRLRLDYNYRF